VSKNTVFIDPLSYNCVITLTYMVNTKQRIRTLEQSAELSHWHPKAQRGPKSNQGFRYSPKKI